MYYSHVLGISLASAALIIATGTARAQEPFDAKLSASIFKTKLVQAVDDCSSPMTVLNGLGACTSGNVNTDGTPFSVGSIIVKSRNVSSQVLTVLRSSSNAGIKSALGGLEVHTRLVLRVTRQSAPPVDAVTFEDQIIDCPSTIVTGTGNLVTRNTFSQCGLAPAPGLHLEEHQKEIVSASVVNTATGKAIAVPGVRRR